MAFRRPYTRKTAGRKNKRVGRRAVRGRYRGRGQGALVRLIKSVINNNVETKHVGGIVENAGLHNAFISSADLFGVLPPLSQGVDAFERIGDKIKPVSLRLKGCLSFNGNYTSASPLIIKLYVLQWKPQRDSVGGFASVPVAQLLDAGGSLTSFDGSAIRAMLPINKNDFDVLATRTFKISDSANENHKCETASYNISVPLPARLLYQAGGRTSPSNFAPFMCIGWYYEDGAIPAAEDAYVYNTTHAMLYFKDA